MLAIFLFFFTFRLEFIHDQLVAVAEGSGWVVVAFAAAKLILIVQQRMYSSITANVSSSINSFRSAALYIRHVSF